MSKILHITESMGGGVLKYISEVTKNLRGFEHSVIYSRGSDTPSDIEAQFGSDVQLYHCQMVKGLKLKSDIHALNELKKLIKLIKPDIIHLHSSKAGFLGRILSWRFPGIRFFFTPHCYSFLMSDKSWRMRKLYWFAEWLLSQSRSTIVACSKSEYRYARRLSWFRKPILVENGMRDHAKLHLRSMRSPIIIGVGRLVAQKNPRLFVEVVAQVKRNHPDVRAVWVGDGPLRKECESYSQELQAGIDYIGALPFNEVFEEMSKAAVYVQTSKWEGLPFTVIEAFSCGLPVVASDIESHRDLIKTNENGFLASHVEQYANALSELLANDRKREFMSARARQTFLSRYTIDLFASKLIEAYELGGASVDGKVEDTGTALHL